MKISMDDLNEHYINKLDAELAKYYARLSAVKKD